MSEAKFTEVEILPGYTVSSDGKVFSISHNWRGLGKRRIKNEVGKDGYIFVRLTVGGKRKKYKIHQLVCEAFNGKKPSSKHEVCHADGDRINNTASNLYWGTRSDNARDRVKHGRQFIPLWSDSGFREKAIAGMLKYHAEKKARAALAKARGEI